MAQIRAQIVARMRRDRRFVQKNYTTFMTEKFSSEQGIVTLIQAQNRTTHAVRAFVRFLFIQLTGITLAAFLWLWEISFLRYLAGVVWIVSVFWSSYAGWKELDKSGIGLEPETTKESLDKDPLEQDRSTTKICSCGAVNSQKAKRCSDCGVKWLLAR